MACSLPSSEFDSLNLILVQAAFIIHLLSLFCFANAAYTFYRRRRYRLFESSVEAVPSTPSAHRVRVDSSPVASSPLRFLSNMLAGGNAEARSHSDASRDVWEIAVWDPAPISLRMFCLFSPGHVLMYWLFLPTALSDIRPSTTIIATILLAALLSAQLLLLQTKYSQQSKDASLINKEVMNEYDIKFVHPRTQPLMRDVGTQFSSLGHRKGVLSDHKDENDAVDLYPPTFIINRGFHTRPNPNYANHIDPDGLAGRQKTTRIVSTGAAANIQTPAHLRDTSSPFRPQTAFRQPQFRPTTAGDGGSLGVLSHANSPLRKSASTLVISPSKQRDGGSSPIKKDISPLKPRGLAPMPKGQQWGQAPATRRESERY